jgi:hypothetical protein
MSEEHVSDEDVEGRLSEDEVSPEVAEDISEAKDAHKSQAADPGATEGQGVEPEVMGHAEPDTGMGEAAESEIPEGVDALSDEQIQAAEERGGGDDAEGGDGGALDVSDVVAEGGEDAEGAAADDAGDDATEMTEPEAQVAPDTGEDA